MMLLICIVLWAWRWLRPAPPKPPPLKADLLTEARKTHPREMQAVDFASWELQMETEEG